MYYETLDEIMSRLERQQEEITYMLDDLEEHMLDTQALGYADEEYLRNYEKLKQRLEELAEEYTLRMDDIKSEVSHGFAP